MDTLNDKEREMIAELKKECLHTQNRIYYRFLLWEDMVSGYITEDVYTEHIIKLNQNTNDR